MKKSVIMLFFCVIVAIHGFLFAINPIAPKYQNNLSLLNMETNVKIPFSIATTILL